MENVFPVLVLLVLVLYIVSDTVAIHRARRRRQSEREQLKRSAELAAEDQGEKRWK